MDQESRTRQCVLARVRDLNSRRLFVASAQRLDSHAAVLTECPAWIVRDLPDVAVGIGEGAGRTAPLRAGGRAQDSATCPFGFGQYGADLLGRADVVGELDPGSTVTAERSPQSEHHAPSLKEADLVIGLLRVVPAERLVERTGSGKIADAKRHEADALVHPEIIADVAACTLMSPTARGSAAEVLLTPDLIGLGQPADELGVDIGRRGEPERMHHIMGRQLLNSQEPWAVDVPGQHQVPG